MASLLTAVLFLATLAVALYAIVATVRSRLDRILEVLSGAPAPAVAPLPVARATVRGMPVRVRAAEARPAWRAAA